jgi:catechol 2,3-dioxygenase-like lactoylglutathione lyase family enzyme
MPALMVRRTAPLALWLAGLLTLLLPPSLAAESRSVDLPTSLAQRSFAVKLTHVCLITPQFARMREFYRRLLHQDPQEFQQDYVEFKIPGAIISLYEEASFAHTVTAFRPQPGAGGMMLEIQVPDVDQEFTHLHSLGLKIDFLMPPTTFPWGNRSMYLKDPDGNLINLYSPVSAP